MPTSGTTAFTLDFTDIAEEAWERAGKEMRTGWQLTTARRSMNLLTIEWQNRGLNMWTIDTGEIPLVAGTAAYDLPEDTIDLMDQVVRTGSGSTQADITCARVSSSNYATIPNKNVQGRPIQVWVRKTGPAPSVVMWPVPDKDDYYTLVYWRMRRVQDAGDGVENPDMPYRFYPALVAGLAFKLAMKDPELRDGAQLLKAEYEEQYQLAAEQDREKASVRLVPRIG